MQDEVEAIPDLEAIRANARDLADVIVATPAMAWTAQEIVERLLPATRVSLKLELFQHTGSFKARGALTNVRALDEEARRRGVTAVSAGNHAIAVAWAAAQVRANAKVVMFRSANPARVAKVEHYGGEVVIVDDVAAAFEEADRLAREDGRTFVHPYEGRLTALGTATLGLEWIEQVPDLDAVIIPIGGGGLAGGMACAMKQVKPELEIIGVEPEGADSMSRSLRAGSPQTLEAVRTIADSLGAPFALPYSFDLCRRFLNDVIRIEDQSMLQAVGFLFETLKLACEPAGAASTAALLEPLRERLAGQHVGVLLCGSNIDLPSFMTIASGGS